MFFFQAEDGIRDLVRSRGRGDVYKRQPHYSAFADWLATMPAERLERKRAEADTAFHRVGITFAVYGCLLYTSDAADERSSVDLGGRRIIKKKKDVVIGW